MRRGETLISDDDWSRGPAEKGSPRVPRQALRPFFVPHCQGHVPLRRPAGRCSQRARRQEYSGTIGWLSFNAGVIERAVGGWDARQEPRGRFAAADEGIVGQPSIRSRPRILAHQEVVLYVLCGYSTYSVAPSAGFSTGGPVDHCRPSTAFLRHNVQCKHSGDAGAAPRGTQTSDSNSHIPNGPLCTTPSAGAAESGRRAPGANPARVIVPLPSIRHFYSSPLSPRRRRRRRGGWSSRRVPAVARPPRRRGAAPSRAVTVVTARRVALRSRPPRSRRPVPPSAVLLAARRRVYGVSPRDGVWRCHALLDDVVPRAPSDRACRAAPPRGWVATPSTAAVVGDLSARHGRLAVVATARRGGDAIIGVRSARPHPPAAARAHTLGRRRGTRRRRGGGRRCSSVSVPLSVRQRARLSAQSSLSSQRRGR